MAKCMGVEKMENKKIVPAVPVSFVGPTVHETKDVYSQKNRQAFSGWREHEFMLIDRPRVDSYFEAISRLVKPGQTVLDLGTGVGILGFFAALQRVEMVYAVDHSDIILAAKRVADFNNIKNIQFINAHSTNVSLDSKIDVIIHEQMGNFLFDEHMVDNVCDLRDRLLKENGIIIPSLFEFFIEPAMVIDEHHVPMLKELNIHGIDYSCLQERGPEDFYPFLWRNDPEAIDHFLCDPKPIYSLDLMTIKPKDLPTQLRFSRKVIKGGRLDGFIVYFHCLLDDDIMFTTGPEKDRATSWKYWLLRVESRDYCEGDMINFELIAKDLQTPGTWEWHCT
jgi:type I protein arginine methyltransferase